MIERLEGRSVPVVSDARVVARIDVADTWMMTDGPFTETKELFGG